MHWMDLLRGAAVLLVITWHATTLPGRYDIDVPQVAGMVNQALAPYRQPMLLVLSGMLLSRSMAKPLPAFFSGKVRMILWPYLVWTVITCLVWQPQRLADPVTWVAGPDHLWFLTVLLVSYAAAPVLRASRVPWWAVPVALWGGWLLFHPAVPGVANWIWFGGYFFAGAALAPHVRRIVGAPWWVALGLAGVALVGVYGALTGDSGGYAWAPHWVVISLAGVGLLVWAAPRVPRTGFVRWVERAGEQSMVWYVAHVPAISLAAWAWSAAGLPGGWLAYLGLLGVGLVVPWVLARWDAVPWLFRLPTRPRVAVRV